MLRFLLREVMSFPNPDHARPARKQPPQRRFMGHDVSRIASLMMAVIHERRN